MRLTLEKLAAKVLEMRMKQNEYFLVASEARKNPAKHADRKRILIESKSLESEVDGMVSEALNKREQIIRAQLTDDEQAEYGQQSFE